MRYLYEKYKFNIDGTIDTKTYGDMFEFKNPSNIINLGKEDEVVSLNGKIPFQTVPYQRKFPEGKIFLKVW